LVERFRWPQIVTTCYTELLKTYHVKISHSTCGRVLIWIQWFLSASFALTKKAIPQIIIWCHAKINMPNLFSFSDMLEHILELCYEVPILAIYTRLPLQMETVNVIVCKVWLCWRISWTCTSQMNIAACHWSLNTESWLLKL